MPRRRQPARLLNIVPLAHEDIFDDCIEGPCCPDATYVQTLVAANPERCTSRDGVWLGQVTRGALPPRTAGDLDGDGKVGTSDLLILLRSWGYPDPTADLDGSGLVDAGDLHRMLLLWKP